MKKRGLIAMLMALFFVLFTLNVFSDVASTDNNSGQSTVTGNDIHGNSTQDTAGTFVPE
jgi:hypothetical protein